LLHNFRVPNRAYARFWCRDFSESTSLALYEQFLATAPLSGTFPGFYALSIRAVDYAETPLAEHDLRLRPATAAEIIEVCREHPGDDLLYEATAYWDLWVFEAGAWRDAAQPVTLACRGEAFDGAAFTLDGHLELDAGLEHLFTGHAGLLTGGPADAAPEHPDEATFLRHMAEPAHLREYRDKTRDNISRLLRCLNQVQAALPIARFVLWSEGEENFEARLDHILAAR
jgi:hypothetical protein